jgi:hypothetical protein
MTSYDVIALGAGSPSGECGRSPCSLSGVSSDPPT